MIWKEEWKIFKNVFTQSSMKTLEGLSDRGFFTELKSPISIGKEANVFSAGTKHGDDIIIKMFRMENAEFNRMRDYLLADPRYAKLKNSRRQIVFAWAQREYRNLMQAREFIRVPTPIAFKDNIILMEFIGENGVPAPMAKDSMIDEPDRFFDEVVLMMKRLWSNGWVHGDLSGFNMLNLRQKPVFIDLTQMTPSKSQNAEELLERDVRNVCSFFRRKDESSSILAEIKKDKE